MKQNQNARHNRGGKQNNQQNRNRNTRGRQKQRPQQAPSGNRQQDSYGPAGKQRGVPKQLYDKYKQLAEDAFRSDRVLCESLYQYADHYYRIYAEFSAAEAAQQAKRDIERDEKQREAAENQANVVSIADGTGGEIEADLPAEKAEKSAKPEEKAQTPAKENPVKEDSKEKEAVAPQEDAAPKPAEKPKRPRKKRVVKEKVAKDAAPKEEAGDS